MDRTLFYAFAISVLLIVVVYFVGVATDAKSLGGAVNSLILTLTARNSNGQFAQYPNTPSGSLPKVA